MKATSYVISARPPVRAFLIAAVASLLGAALLVGSQMWKWHLAVAVLGGVILGLGLALAVTGWLVMQRNRRYLELTDKGYHLSGTTAEVQGGWGGVTKVTLARSERRIAIHEGERRRNLVFRAGADEQLEEIAEDIVARLKEHGQQK